MWSFHEPLLVPPEPAAALRQARLRAGLTLERVAEASGVPSARIAALESGTVSDVDDPRLLLVVLERFANCVGLPPGVTVEDTLRGWSSAYRRECRRGRRRAALVDEPTGPWQAAHDIAAESRADALRTDAPRAGAARGDESIAAEARAQESDTDRVPARPPGSLSRALVGAVWLAAAALVASSATLGAAHAGVLRHLKRDTRGTAPVAAPVQASPSGPLLAQVATGPEQATYRVAEPTFQLTIASSNSAWVRVSAGGAAVFSGILAPGEARSFGESGAVVVEVGADGTVISVSSHGRSDTLSPPGAPFTYQLATNADAR